jgi:hypothetical protein
MYWLNDGGLIETDANGAYFIFNLVTSLSDRKAPVIQAKCPINSFNGRSFEGL